MAASLAQLGYLDVSAMAIFFFFFEGYVCRGGGGGGGGGMEKKRSSLISYEVLLVCSLKSFEVLPETIYRKFCKDIYRFFFDGMNELQTAGVQTNAPFTASPWVSIFIIFHYGAVHLWTTVP